MDSLISMFGSFMNTMGKEEYIFFGMMLLLFCLLVYLYLVKKEKKKLKILMSSHQKVFQKAFNNAKDAMLILSNKNKIIYANTAMLDLCKLKKNELSSNMPKINIKKKWLTLDTFLEAQQSREVGETLTFPRVLLKVKHKEILVNIYLNVLTMDKNSYLNIITIQDLAYLNQSVELTMKHQLTGLPNQHKILQELPLLFSKIHADDDKVALVLLSLDNFSNLRSIIGFNQSNDVIIKFSEYLTNIVSQMSIGVYHTFDNHFLLTVSNVKSSKNIKELVVKIQKELHTFYKVKDVNLHLTVSVGIALHEETKSTLILLDNTYKALSQATEKREGRIIVYHAEKSKNKYDEFTLHNDIKIGLKNGEFEVHYQPIVMVKNQKVVAAEALIRWIHPKYGFIPPDVFIGIMEKTGFIVDLGQFVLEEVLKQQKRWELFKFKSIEVSINVSMVEIATGKFVEHVKKQLHHHQVFPEKIKFEITEGIAMIGESKTEKYFHNLKKLGVGISLDDFGTGYTSFTYLKKFPADTLKIDKSLIDNILSSKEDQRIVHAMIELGHNIGMKVVVEGVESKEMFEMVASYGCDYIQGYYFSKPLPVFEFQKLLREEKINQ